MKKITREVEEDRIGEKEGEPVRRRRWRDEVKMRIDVYIKRLSSRALIQAGQERQTDQNIE